MFKKLLCVSTAIGLTLILAQRVDAQEAPAAPKAEPGIVTDELNFNAISGNVYSPDIKFNFGETEYSLRSAYFDGDLMGVPYDNHLNFTDSFNYKLNYNHDSSGYPLVENNISKCFLTITANVQGASFKFPCFNPVGAYEAENSDGSILTPSYDSAGNLRLDYTSRDGLVVRFSIAPPSWGGAASVINLSTNGVNAFEVVEPDGEKLKINHTAAFVSSTNGQPTFEVKREVISNAGYQVAYRYNSRGHVSSVKFINSAVEYCNYTTNKCQNTSQPWQELIINNSVSATDGGTSPYVTTVQDPSGVVTTFTINQPSGNPKFVLSIDRNGRNLTSYTTWTASPSEFISGGGAIINRGGASWTYGIDKFLPYGNQMRDQHTVSVGRTDSQGKSRSYSGNPTKGFLFRYTDELSRSVRQFYDANGRLEYVVSPEGTIGADGRPSKGYVKYKYDARGNVEEKLIVPKQGSSEPNIISTAGYDAVCSNRKTCNKPNWILDARGSRTDFTYHPQSGGVASVLSPEAKAGAGRRLQIVSYTALYGWVKNAGGQLVQEAEPIWKISSLVDCRWSPNSNPAVCSSTDPKSEEIYEYGAAGTRESLLLKGYVKQSGSTTLRTCYSYDLYNRRVTETRPKANLSSCP